MCTKHIEVWLDISMGMVQEADFLVKVYMEQMIIFFGVLSCKVLRVLDTQWGVTQHFVGSGPCILTQLISMELLLISGPAYTVPSLQLVWDFKCSVSFHTQLKRFLFSQICLSNL